MPAQRPSTTRKLNSLQMQGSLEKKTKTYWHQPRAQDGSNLAPRYSVKLTLKSQQTCNITRVQHKSICLSFTVPCLPVPGLGLWRNWWPNYIDPQNLFTALGLLKEQLIITHTKNTSLLSGTVRESKETGCSLTRVRSTIELKAQRSTVSLQPVAYLHYFTFLWKKSRYRTTDCTWNFFLRGSLKAKQRWADQDLFWVISVCHFTVTQLHPPLSIPPK